MQPVKFLKFLRQFVVLVERNLQLIWNDKLLLASLNAMEFASLERPGWSSS